MRLGGSLCFSVFLLLWGVIALFCLCGGGTLSLGVSKSLIYKLIPMPVENVYAFSGEMIVSGKLTLQMFLMPVLIVSAFSILQMTASLWIKPFFSFCISAGVLVLSAYYLHPAFLGNYAMSQRNSILIQNGVRLEIGIMFSAVLLLISCMVGLCAFRRYDILNKE